MCLHFVIFFVLAIVVTITMAPPLAPPKGFKFRRFFSRSDPNSASSSHVPPSDVDIPTLGDGDLQPATPLVEFSVKKKTYDKTRQFQLLWLPIFPWAEPIYKGDEVTKVICKVCSKIRGKSIILCAKSDNLWKHQGRKTAKGPGHGVAVGEKYMDSNSIHLKNERLFAAIPTDSIAAQVAENTVRDRKKKWIQFATLLHLLQRGRPITDYEQMYVLFETLKLKKNPHHHWSDNSGWAMAEAIERVVLKRTKEVMQVANFFSLSCDEVTSVY